MKVPIDLIMDDHIHESKLICLECGAIHDIEDALDDSGCLDITRGQGIDEGEQITAVCKNCDNTSFFIVDKPLAEIVSKMLVAGLITVFSCQGAVHREEPSEYGDESITIDSSNLINIKLSFSFFSIINFFFHIKIFLKIFHKKFQYHF